MSVSEVVGQVGQVPSVAEHYAIAMQVYERTGNSTVGAIRFESPTSWPDARRSVNIFVSVNYWFYKRWSGRKDLNLRPPGPEPGALARLRYAPTSTAERCSPLDLGTQNNTAKDGKPRRCGSIANFGDISAELCVPHGKAPPPRHARVTTSCPQTDKGHGGGLVMANIWRGKQKGREAPPPGLSMSLLARS